MWPLSQAGFSSDLPLTEYMQYGTTELESAGFRVRFCPNTTPSCKHLVAPAACLRLPPLALFAKLQMPYTILHQE